MSNTTFTIDIRILQGIACLCSKDASRYVLTGVCVQIRHKDIRVSATNGRCLACYRIEESLGVERTVILPVFWLGYLKVGKLPKVQLTCNENKFEVEHAEKTFKGTLIDGIFPNWTKVVPTEEVVPVKSFNFDLNLASDFIRCLRLIHPGKAPSVVIRQHKDELGPISIWSDIDPNFYGIQMPVRCDTTKIPEWVTA
jgi:hypothetical protein